MPHVHASLEADLTAGLADAKPLPLACAALARALRAHAECNLAWIGGRLAQRGTIDLGVLVDTPAGLLLPTVRDADQLGMVELAAALAQVAARARAGSLRSDDYAPRSATVSNLGMYAVDRFDGVIAAPDVLLLTVGRVRTVPRWHDGSWAPCQVADLTLAFDHRALDGADAGRLLTAMERLLREPTELHRAAPRRHGLRWSPWS